MGGKNKINNNTDAFSQDVLVSQIELLLNYSNRFYNRQFLTRKAVHHDLISQMDTYLANRFADHSGSIPTVLAIEKVGLLVSINIFWPP